MNIAILTYSVYFAIMAFIIVRVGWLFYSNGQAYIDVLFADQPDYGKWINRMLLKAYYLFNLGYVAISISSWGELFMLQSALAQLISSIGTICGVLALMHYLNMLALLLWSEYKTSSISNNNSKTIHHGT